MAAGIKEVARRAGVSPATVSRVLGGGSVSAGLRSRVEQAVAETGYRPNLSARRLRSRHSHSIGVVVTDVGQPASSALCRAVEEAAYGANLRIILGNSAGDPVREAAYLRLMQEERITGLICMPTRQSGEAIARNDYDFPVVFVDLCGAISRHDCVGIDNEEAMRDLVAGLHRRGVRRLAGLFAENETTTDDRLKAFLSASGEREVVAKSHFVPSDTSAAADLTRSLLSRGDRPDAIVAADGALLVGVVRALRSLGLETPADVAVAGFGDEDWSELVDPGLTVISQPIAEMGRAAMSLLFERLRHPDLAPRRVMLAGRLVPRGSTALPRPGDGRGIDALAGE